MSADFPMTSAVDGSLRLLPGADLAALLRLPAEQVAWQASAVCAQADPEIFYPDKGGSTGEAKRICQGCEVRAECLEYALAHDERFGIYGGLSPRERHKLRRPASVIGLEVA